MFEPSTVESETLLETLIDQGYQPAQAAKYLAEEKYPQAVEICKEFLREQPGSVAGRVIYGLALYRAGQTEAAAEQFYQVLSVDPDNLVALKYLGDMRFAEGDEVAAMANYCRILEIDPQCKGLKSDLIPQSKESVRTITITREPESSTEKEAASPRWRIPFYTETIGDLYLAQGHPRLAAEVYRVLNEKKHNPRLQEKLVQAERKTRISEPTFEKDN